MQPEVAFELETFEERGGTEQSVLLRVTGSWWAEEAAELREPQLVVYTAEGARRAKPLDVPDRMPPVAAPERRRWAATYGVERELLEGEAAVALELPGRPAFPLPPPTPRTRGSLAPTPAYPPLPEFAAPGVRLALTSFEEIRHGAPGRLLRLSGTWEVALGAEAPDLRLRVRILGQPARMVSPVPGVGSPPPEPGERREWTATYALPARLAPLVPPVGFSLVPLRRRRWPLPPPRQAPPPWIGEEATAPANGAGPREEGGVVARVRSAPSRARRRLSAHLDGRLVLASVLAAMLGALALSAVDSPEYEARADLLLNPIAEESPLAELPLLRQTGDPTQTRTTAAELIASSLAEVRTARELGGGWRARDVRRKVEVAPSERTEVIRITGTDGTAAGAARLANTYARTVLRIRAEQLRDPLRLSIARAQRRFSRIPDPESEAGEEAARFLTQLRTLEGRDPTLSLETPARAPARPLGLPLWARLLASALAGLVLGVGGGLLVARLTVRPVRDEREAMDALPAPVLLRLPALRGGTERLAARAAPGPWLDSFLGLRTELELEPDDPQVVLFTSATPRDGRTTCAAGFALALAEAGQSVVAIDLDVRRPGLAARLGTPPRRGLEHVLGETASLRDCLTEVEGRPGLAVAAALQPLDGPLLGLLGTRVQALVEEACLEADWVVLDSPPLGSVGDTLRVAGVADAVLVVVRPGVTSARGLEALAGSLARARVRVAGMVLNAVRTREGGRREGSGAGRLVAGRDG